MAKGMCISGMVVAGIILFVFSIDLIANLAGQTWLAPFKGASQMMDIAFVICAAVLGFLSWSTWKEQV